MLPVEQNYLSARCQPKKGSELIKQSRRCLPSSRKGEKSIAFFLKEITRSRGHPAGVSRNHKFHLRVLVVEPAMAILQGVMHRDAWDICEGDGLSGAQPGLQLFVIFRADSYRTELSRLFTPYHPHHKYTSLSLSLSSLLNMVQIELVIFTL